MKNLFIFLSVFFTLFIVGQSAYSQESAYTIVEIDEGQIATDLGNVANLYRNQGNIFTVSTAPDAVGVVRRIEVRAVNPNSSGNWLAFAIANTGEEQLDRLIVAPHFRLARSGIWQPDLGKKRIFEILPSEGFKLDRQQDPNADIFRVTLNPGTIVTFVGELASENVPQLTLWNPEAYKDAVNSYTLYEGIIIGIAGLLAVFLTIIFIVKGAFMFPTAALLAWSVLFYVCAEFGFLAKIFLLSPEGQNIARASVEVFLTTSLAIFMYAYLHLNRWHTQYSYLLGFCLVALVFLAGVTFFSPEFSAGAARVAFAIIAGGGLFVILFLVWQTFDRAILLLPTWALLFAWTWGYYLAIVGDINNDVIQHGLAGALVLIMLLISFTVLQHAFGGEALSPNLLSNVERQAVALAGSQATVWDWEVDRDEIFVGKEVAKALGVKEKDLLGPVSKWIQMLHPQDRDKFKVVLDIMVEKRRGKIAQDFRLQTKHGDYKWWRIEARPMVASDGEVARCVGTIKDVTNYRIYESRMLFDAVHDKITGLPNKEIFFDRIENAITIAKMRTLAFNPTCLFIDIDDFSGIKAKFGNSFADLVLLSITNRIVRFIKPQDCLARLSDNQFGLLILSQSHSLQTAKIAETIHQAIKEKMILANQEIVATVSIGIVAWSQEQSDAINFLKDAEIAMYYAKRFGGDAIEPFQPSMRAQQREIWQSQIDLKQAIENNEIKISYHPIVHIKSRKIAGFQAAIKWLHPTHGDISSQEFIRAGEKNQLIEPLCNMILKTVIEKLAKWQVEYPQNNIFISVNIGSHQMIHHHMVEKLKNLLKVNVVLPSKLKLEIAEENVMHNPQFSIPTLQKLREIGIGISIDDFGEGYSSLPHLGKFSFDAIKINPSFLQDDSEKNVILKYIIAMAHELKMQTIAYGVCDESEMLKLKKMGCQYMQGEIFGEPFTEEMVQALLARHYSKNN